MILSICSIGAVYVGGTTMAVIADRFPQIQVTVVDLTAERIAAWNDPDLSQLPVLSRGSMRWWAGREADMVFLSVNTPTETKGVGAGQASDLRRIEVSARQVAACAQGHTIVVKKSTLLMRTAETVQTILSALPAAEGKTFSVLSNPEFLAECTAIADLQAPDRR